MDTDIANIETTVRGYRWVTMIGRLDHAKMRELHAKAIKTDEADPHYLRLELERQVQGSDSEWSEWTPVKRDVYLNVKRILTDEEAERVPKDSILAPLVDPLPFLQVGYWVGAHHGALLPKEVLTPKPVTAENGELGGGRGKGGGMMGGSNKASAGNYAKGGVAPGGGDYGAGMGGMGAMGSNEGMGEGADGRSAGGGAGGGAGRGPAEADFDKTKADWIMIRALDFDVEADTVYRYRVRIVVANPNYQWENVSPGVDTKVKELKGPWSVETAAVNVPADVSTYAIQKVPPAADPSGLKVEFQVVKWSPEDGLTVVHKFEQSPGDIIGSKHGIAVPDPKKPDERKTQQYDFTSRQILADVSGGERPPSALQALGTPRFSTPAFALVVRNDGLLVIRDQTTDAGNGEMKEMADIYAEIMKEIGAPKKKGSSSMMGGMGEGGMGGGGGMGNQ